MNAYSAEIVHHCITLQTHVHVGEVNHWKKHLCLDIWDLNPFQCPVLKTMYVTVVQTAENNMLVFVRACVAIIVR